MNTSIIVALIVALPPTLTAFAGLWFSYKNLHAISEVHLSINSRMDELIKEAKGVSLAEGREIGRSENKQ